MLIFEIRGWGEIIGGKISGGKPRQRWEKDFIDVVGTATAACTITGKKTSISQKHSGTNYDGMMCHLIALNLTHGTSKLHRQCTLDTATNQMNVILPSG